MKALAAAAVLFLWNSSVFPCSPCESSLTLQETVAQADLIIIGQKIGEFTEPGIPPETPPEILIRIDQIVKGFVKEKDLRVHSFSADCPYAIVLDDKQYLIFLEGPPWTAVNNGCAVKTLPPQEIAKLGLPVWQKPKPDILFLVDLSGSMEGFLGPVGPIKRIDCAKSALLETLAQLPPDQEIGLRVFGHRQPMDMFDCKDTELLVPIGGGQKEKIIERVKAFRATGSALLSYSLVQTELDFAARKERLHKLIVITYGEDSCGNDPLLAARDIANKGFALEVSVIGLDATETVQQKLGTMANEFGGTFVNVKSCQELVKTMDEQLAGVGEPLEPKKEEGDEKEGRMRESNPGGINLRMGGDCSPAEAANQKKACGVGLWILLLLLLIWAIWRYWKRRRDRKKKEGKK